MNKDGKSALIIFGLLMIVIGGAITASMGFDAYWHILSQSYTYQLNGIGEVGIIVAILGVIMLIVGIVAEVKPDTPYTYGPPPPVYYSYQQPQPIQTTCPVCGKIFQAGFLSCPRCGTKLKTYCISCGQMVDTRATICPYCNSAMEK